MKPVRGTIENWRMVDTGSCWVVTGSIHGHPTESNGNFIRTSSVRFIDLDKKEIETLNSIYKIGVAFAPVTLTDRKEKGQGE